MRSKLTSGGGGGGGVIILLCVCVYMYVFIVYVSQVCGCVCTNFKREKKEKGDTDGWFAPYRAAPLRATIVAVVSSSGLGCT